MIESRYGTEAEFCELSSEPLGSSWATTSLSQEGLCAWSELDGLCVYLTTLFPMRKLHSLEW
jgi:hypothetical protein